MALASRSRPSRSCVSELEDGVAALSASILDQSGRALGVINVTWPSFRVSQAERERFKQDLIDAGVELSSMFDSRHEGLSHVMQ